MFYAVRQSPTLSALFDQRVRGVKPQQIFDQSGAITILILGCDEDRYYGGKQILDKAARSDMMLLARMDFTNKKITALSIPRDIVVELPGFRRHRINAYHSLGKDSAEGRELSKRAVEYLLSVDIDRVVDLNYGAFQDMVNLVGGVEIFVPKNLKYTDKAGDLFIDIKAGRQTLNGYDAMCFVRYRKGDSDFERQSRQKDLMLAFKQKVMSMPGKLPMVTEKARDVLGGVLSAEEVAALALFAQEIGNDNVKMGQIPVVDLEGGNKYDLAVDRRKVEEVLRFHNFRETNTTALRN